MKPESIWFTIPRDEDLRSRKNWNSLEKNSYRITILHFYIVVRDDNNFIKGPKIDEIFVPEGTDVARESEYWEIEQSEFSVLEEIKVALDAGITAEASVSADLKTGILDLISKGILSSNATAKASASLQGTLENHFQEFRSFKFVKIKGSRSSTRVVADNTIHPDARVIYYVSVEPIHYDLYLMYEQTVDVTYVRPFFGRARREINSRIPEAKRLPICRITCYSASEHQSLALGFYNPEIVDADKLRISNIPGSELTPSDPLHFDLDPILGDAFPLMLRRVPAKKAVAKKAVAKKAVAKKAVAKKAVAKKAPAKKVSPRKAAAKKAPVKKGGVKKSAARKSPTRKAGKKRGSFR